MADAETSTGECEPGQGPKVQEKFTDGRAKGDWQSHFPVDAQREIRFEAYVLGSLLLLTLLAAGAALGLVDATRRVVPVGSLEIDVNFRLLAIFFTGCVGGATFSIKWLVHSVAKEKWHLDRRYWRLLTPAIGGVYACVVLTLAQANILSGGGETQVRGVAGSAALAFLVGYFSDGVSGLLSNVANAVFGTLEKK